MLCDQGLDAATDLLSAPVTIEIAMPLRPHGRCGRCGDVVSAWNGTSKLKICYVRDVEARPRRPTQSTGSPRLAEESSAPCARLAHVPCSGAALSHGEQRAVQLRDLALAMAEMMAF